MQRIPPGSFENNALNQLSGVVSDQLPDVSKRLTDLNLRLGSLGNRVSDLTAELSQQDKGNGLASAALVGAIAAAVASGLGSAVAGLAEDVIDGVAVEVKDAVSATRITQSDNLLRAGRGDPYNLPFKGGALIKVGNQVNTLYASVSKSTDNLHKAVDRLAKLVSQATGVPIAQVPSVIPRSDLKPGAGGSYKPGVNQINLPANRVNELQSGKLSRSTIRILLHELAHWAQSGAGSQGGLKALREGRSYTRLDQGTREEQAAVRDSVQKSVQKYEGSLPKDFVARLEQEAYVLSERMTRKLFGSVPTNRSSSSSPPSKSSDDTRMTYEEFSQAKVLLGNISNMLREITQVHVGSNPRLEVLSDREADRSDTMGFYDPNDNTINLRESHVKLLSRIPTDVSQVSEELIDAINTLFHEVIHATQWGFGTKIEDVWNKGQIYGNRLQITPEERRNKQQSARNSVVSSLEEGEMSPQQLKTYYKLEYEAYVWADKFVDEFLDNLDKMGKGLLDILYRDPGEVDLLGDIPDDPFSVPVGYRKKKSKTGKRRVNKGKLPVDEPITIDTVAQTVPTSIDTEITKRLSEATDGLVNALKPTVEAIRSVNGDLANQLEGLLGNLKDVAGDPDKQRQMLIGGLSGMAIGGADAGVIRELLLRTVTEYLQSVDAIANRARRELEQDPAYRDATPIQRTRILRTRSEDLARQDQQSVILGRRAFLFRALGMDSRSGDKLADTIAPRVLPTGNPVADAAKNQAIGSTISKTVNDVVTAIVKKNTTTKPPNEPPQNLDLYALAGLDQQHNELVQLLQASADLLGQGVKPLAELINKLPHGTTVTGLVKEQAANYLYNPRQQRDFFAGDLPAILAGIVGSTAIASDKPWSPENISAELIATLVARQLGSDIAAANTAYQGLRGNPEFEFKPLTEKLVQLLEATRAAIRQTRPTTIKGAAGDIAGAFGGRTGAMIAGALVPGAHGIASTALGIAGGVSGGMPAGIAASVVTEKVIAGTIKDETRKQLEGSLSKLAASLSDLNKTVTTASDSVRDKVRKALPSAKSESNDDETFYGSVDPRERRAKSLKTWISKTLNQILSSVDDDIADAVQAAFQQLSDQIQNLDASGLESTFNFDLSDLDSVKQVRKKIQAWLEAHVDLIRAEHETINASAEAAASAVDDNVIDVPTVPLGNGGNGGNRRPPSRSASEPSDNGRRVERRGFTGNLLESITAIGGSIALFEGLRKVAAQLLEVNWDLVASYEQIQINVDRMSGAGSFDRVVSKSKDLGVNLRQSAQQAAQISALLQGTRFENSAIDFASALGKAQNLYGLDNEATQRLVTALSQAQSKGRLLAEEYTGQLAEIPGAQGLVARAKGISLQDLNEQVRNSQAYGDTLVEVARYLETVQVNTDTLIASQNRLTNAQELYERSRGNANAGLQKFLNAAQASALTVLADNMDVLNAAFTGLATVIGGAILIDLGSLAIAMVKTEKLGGLLARTLAQMPVLGGVFSKLTGASLGAAAGIGAIAVAAVGTALVLRSLYKAQTATTDSAKTYRAAIDNLIQRIAAYNKEAAKVKPLKFEDQGGIPGFFDWLATLGKGEYTAFDKKRMSSSLTSAGLQGSDKASYDATNTLRGAGVNALSNLGILGLSSLGISGLSGSGTQLTNAARKLINDVQDRAKTLQDTQEALISGEQGVLFELSNLKVTGKDGKTLVGKQLYDRLKELDQRANSLRLQAETLKAQGAPSSRVRPLQAEADQITDQRRELGKPLFERLSVAEEGAKAARKEAEELRKLAAQFPLMAQQYNGLADSNERLAERLDRTTKAIRNQVTELSNAAAIATKLEAIQTGLATKQAENELDLAVRTKYTPKSAGQEAVQQAQVSNLELQKSKLQRDLDDLGDAVARTAKLLDTELNDRAKVDINAALKPYSTTLDTATPELLRKAQAELSDLAPEYQRILEAVASQRENIRTQRRVQADINQTEVQIKDTKLDLLNSQRQFAIQSQRFWEDYGRGIADANADLIDQLAQIRQNLASVRLDRRLNSEFAALRQAFGAVTGSAAQELRSLFLGTVKSFQQKIRAQLSASQGMDSALSDIGRMQRGWVNDAISRARSASDQLSTEAEYRQGTAEGVVPRNPVPVPSLPPVGKGGKGLPSLPPIPGYNFTSPPVGQLPGGKPPTPMPKGASKFELPLTPPVKRLLDLISRVEGGWTSFNRGTTRSAGVDPNLTKKTIGQVMREQEANQKFAVGAYQIIPDTMKIAVRESGLKLTDLFNEFNQRILGLTLMLGSKNPELRDYLKGGKTSLNAAQNDLATEWAGVPGASGRGAHDGDKAGNMANRTIYSEVRRALIEARSALSGSPSNQTLQASPPITLSGLPPLPAQNSLTSDTLKAAQETGNRDLDQANQDFSGNLIETKEGLTSLLDRAATELGDLKKRLIEFENTISQGNKPLDTSNPDVEFRLGQQDIANQQTQLDQAIRDYGQVGSVIKTIESSLGSLGLSGAELQSFLGQLDQVKTKYSELSESAKRLRSATNQAVPGDVGRTIAETLAQTKQSQIDRATADREATTVRTPDREIAIAIAQINAEAVAAQQRLSALQTERLSQLLDEQDKLQKNLNLQNSAGLTEQQRLALSNQLVQVQQELAQVKSGEWANQRNLVIEEQRQLDILQKRLELQNRSLNAGFDMQRRGLQSQLDNPFASMLEKESLARDIAYLDYNQQMANVPQMLRDLNIGLVEGTARWYEYKTAAEAALGQNLQNNLANSYGTIREISDGISTALMTNFNDILVGQKTLMEGLRGMALGILQSISQAITQILQQIIASGISKMLIGMFGGGGGGIGSIGGSSVSAGGSFLSAIVGGFADGGEVIPTPMGNDPTSLGVAAIKALNKEGSNSVLAALTPGEQVLTNKNGDASLYRSLQRSGDWQRIKQVQLYSDGGMIGTQARHISQTNQKRRAMGTYPSVVSMTVYAKDAASFRASKDQITSEMALAYDRAKAKNG